MHKLALDEHFLFAEYPLRGSLTNKKRPPREVPDLSKTTVLEACTTSEKSTAIHGTWTSEFSEQKRQITVISLAS